ncbi:MAG TPA: acylneuraminate cytidylyltransferase family protein [Burkholderiales bacterium]|jgi:pseudaminic acid cytidylyltransferase|nr:acylneuraminate cytidylyltransferase family protein [Burkholderiales bacterium]
MRGVCIIPARGGSKRLPRKNIAEFLGRPILSYTIDAALTSGIFSRVVVSTEDAEIAGVARGTGAEIHGRPDTLATDSASLVDVCLTFLDDEERAGRSFDFFACLLATAPMRTAEDVKRTHALIEPGLCDFTMAVTTYPLPPLQALRTNDGFLRPMFPDMINLRSQEAPQLFVDNGSTYFALVSAFRKERTFYGSRLRGHVMPRDRSVDIDEPFDLELARMLAQRRGT